MKTLVALLVVIALVALAVLALRKKATSASREEARRRLLVTKNEQPMYFRLREAFPEHVPLAQVAFSGLLTARSRRTRNTFDRKVADFVLCSKAFEVVAVIELDDSSHASKSRSDAERGAVLTRAGYTVLHFKRVPDVEELRKAVAAIPSQPNPA